LIKRAILILSLALFSLTLILACGKPEEPAKAREPEPKQQTAAEKTPAEEPKRAVEAKAEAAKEAQVPKTAEHEKKMPAQHEAKPQEPVKQEHAKPEHTKSQEKHRQPTELNQALLAYLAKTGVDKKYVDPHRTAHVDLNGDGLQDALVLLENPMYCGTCGCTMLVFKGTKSGFEFVSRSTCIRSPVLVSDTRTHGWRDLIVEVSGGGVAPKQAALKYTGSKYPLNPSTLPALPKKQPLKGTKVLQDESS
jgi:hypothetical protein